MSEEEIKTETVSLGSAKIEKFVDDEIYIMSFPNGTKMTVWPETDTLHYMGHGPVYAHRASKKYKDMLWIQRKY